tara:strand:- start:305 stop:535 length:231 start_codon:yes stop_codon:yes gene_type:complete
MGARITGARYWEHGFNPLLDGGNGGDCAACKNTAILLISAELQGARYGEHGMGRIDIFKIKDARLWKIFNLLGTSI